MSNQQIVKQAKFGLKTYLGLEDWVVFTGSELQDIKLNRGPVILTYHRKRQIWSAHIVRHSKIMVYGDRAHETYTLLREELEDLSKILARM